MSNWYPKGTLTQPFLPVDISKLQEVFPANVAALLPPDSDIPDDFIYGHNKWLKFIGGAFFCGFKSLELVPKEGIDSESAWRHVKTILGSWEPKHEYKEAACAYLMSLWFEDVKWEPREIKMPNPYERAT